MLKAPSLKVRRDLGEKAIILLKKLALIDRELKILREGFNLYIPLLQWPLNNHLEEMMKAFSEYEVTIHDFPKRTKCSTKLVEALKDRLPRYLLASIPHSIDFVGDIAIIEIPNKLNDYKRVIGDEMLNIHKRLRTVLAKSSAIRGVHRLREYEIIAGEEKSETLHKEYGCCFLLDIRKVYFSPRLSYERWRVSRLVQPNEVIVNLFAGVGCFSIMIARYADPKKIHSIDINPVAIHYTNENLKLNNVNRVIPILGDARKVIKKRLKRVGDRVIMQLPEKAFEYLDVATLALKSRGTIHYYSFVEEDKIALERVRVLKRLSELGYKGEIVFERMILSIAPKRYEAVFDINVELCNTHRQ